MITAPLVMGADPGFMRLLRQAADAWLQTVGLRRLGSPGAVADHLVAPRLVPGDAAGGDQMGHRDQPAGGAPAGAHGGP